MAFPDSPQAVYWSLTPKCNLRCVYCFADASPTEKGELNTAESLAAVESIASVKPRWVFFTGGEPMVRADLFRLAASCRSHGISTGLLTNATLIDGPIVEAIVRGFDSVAISLDSADPALHDATRGQGSHVRTMRGIELLIREGLTPSINTTVTNVNINDIFNLARLMRDMGVTQHRLSVHMPVGRGKNDCLGCDEGQLVGLLGRILSDGAWQDLKRESPATFQSYLPRRFRPKSQCGLGTNELSVDHLGTVYPCRLLNSIPELAAGNVLENALSSIYHESPVLQGCRKISVEDISECRSCAYRYFCGGGCRALAYHDTGNLLAPFTGMCSINQLEFRFLLAEERTAAYAEQESVLREGIV
jgi:radical SAM protein with 4Fe4S-binding SPASM domain